MAKTPFVLQALSILGLEQILKLSEALNTKVGLKKAAGEELIVWDEAPERAPQKDHQGEAQVLQFPKKSITEFTAFKEDPPEQEKNSDQKAEADASVEKVLPSDLLLWQREISRESGGAIQKIDAMKGYQKSTQMYVVKSKTPEGKQKIRFASTNGILVNKKQA